MKKTCVSFLSVVVFLSICFAAYKAYADPFPSGPQIVEAKAVTTTLTNRLFALLLDEFASTTPANADIGSQAISLVFDNNFETYRLVGAIDVLDLDNLPKDDFEFDSLELALGGNGNESVEKIEGKYYFRRSIPLSNFDASCVLCHTAFGTENDPVGALMLRTPIGHTQTD